MIEARQISFAYSRQSQFLKSCSFVLEPNKLHVLLGTNGSGKSTLLKLLARDLSPDSGQVLMGGKNIETLSLQALAQQRAVLLQQSEQHFAFPVAVCDLLLLACYARRQASHKKNQFVIAELAELLNLQSLLSQNYQTLSGGEKQRVQVARALIQIWPDNHNHNEKVKQVYLLLDEPCSALDMFYSHQVLGLLRDLCHGKLAKAKGLQFNCLLVMHDINAAIKYADNVLLMRAGEVFAQGDVEAVLIADNIMRCFSVSARLHRDDQQRLLFIETGSE